MATHAAGAAARPALLHPVQLTLQLCSIRAGRPHSSYWERVDLADVGGELQARNHAVRVLLGAQPDCGGTWTGYYDALFFSNTGVSGPTRPLPSRLDALSTAAHAVARHCRLLISPSAAQPRADIRAAKEVIRWLELLDLL